MEFAGRICYFSFGPKQSPRTNAEYIANLIDRGHESVLEHATWSFVLSGVSRGFTHQFVRHRVGFSFSQLSQQYHDESAIPFVVPEAVESNPEALALWRETVQQARESYRNLLDTLEHAGCEMTEPERLRLRRSAARSVLPAASETTLAFTANARSLRHFLRLRGEIEGDQEMRTVSSALLRALQAEAPALFADFTLEDGAAGPIVRQRP